ncbi:MAG TPA: hypothetical protein VKT29_13165, partial [Terriglobales bacterium]|nr:hypothetical protein [Terriglobales bacterium]
MANVALTDLLGAPVYDPAGASGRVREVAIRPQEDPLRVAALVVKTRQGPKLLPFSDVASIDGGIRAAKPVAEWLPEPGH